MFQNYFPLRTQELARAADKSGTYVLCIDRRAQGLVSKPRIDAAQISGRQLIRLLARLIEPVESLERD